jgi:hypothetical protein
MVLHTGGYLGAPWAGQLHAVDDVQLPQLHMRVALPPLVLALVLLGLRVDQAVAHQHSIYGGRDGAGSTPRPQPPAAEHPGPLLAAEECTKGLVPAGLVAYGLTERLPVA